MSLLCAAGHMESSQCVWRRWQKTSTATATATERVAAVFWFLLSAMAMANKHTLSQQSFVQFLRFLPVPVILQLSSAHTISFVLLPHTPHTPMLAFSLPLLSLAFRSSLSRQFARFTLLLSTLSLPRWRSFHSCILHISLAFLFPLYDHCVCELLSVCVCALPLSLCWLPVLLLLLASVTKISLSSFCLPYYPMLFLFLMFYLRAGMCVCACPCERLRVSFTFAFCGYYDARWVPFLSRIIRLKHCEPSLSFSLSLSASSTIANSDRILSFLCVCICK